MKKYVRVTLFVGAWAVITWVYRDKLLRVARPDENSVPRIRQPQASSTPHDKRTPSGEASSAVDDLTTIKGIGPVYQSRLADAGIRTFSELASADSGTIAAAIDAAESMIDDWIDQARRNAR